MSRTVRLVMSLLATGLGTGFSPVAPGTVGSAAAALLFLLASILGPAVPWVAFLVILPLAFAGSAYGVRTWGNDPPRVTIDEIAGCWIACLAAPDGILWLAAAVILFRIFDILKPWPISVFDRMEGAAGVVLDDLAAGAVAGAILVLGGALSGAG